MGWAGITPSGMAVVSWSSTSRSPRVATYEIASGQLLQRLPDLAHVFESPSEVTAGCSGAVSPSGEHLGLAFAGKHRWSNWIVFLNLKTGTDVRHMHAHQELIDTRLSWNPSGTYLLVEGSCPQASHAACLLVVNAATVKPLDMRAHWAHLRHDNCAWVSADRRLCALPGQARFLCLDSNRSIQGGPFYTDQLQRHGCFSPCNRLFVMVSREGSCGASPAWRVHHWLLKSSDRCERSKISDLALLSSCDRPVLAWHPQLTSQLIYAFSEGGPSIHIIDGRQNTCIHVWTLPGQQCLHTEKVLGLDWSPDGLWLVATTAGYVHTFNLAGLA